MKKLLFIILALFISIAGFAQLEIDEGSFKKVEGFVNINLDKMYDGNDQPYAVLKIKTESIDGKQRRQLDIASNIGTYYEIDYRDGEIWVYISYYASSIKISHETLGETEFKFPFEMHPTCGYELTLINKATLCGKGWASLTIKTRPENGAAILLNDRSINETTPYTNNMLPPGKYEVTVSKERFVKTTQIIEIQEGDNKTVEIDMQFARGCVTIESEPLVATVYIDDDNYGITPVELNSIIVGSHVIKIEKHGYATVVKTITVDDNNKLIIHERLSVGSDVYISTDGVEDKIFVDSIYIGKSPITITVGEGKHVVTAIRDCSLSNNGIRRVVKAITVDKNGKPTSVHLPFFANKTFNVNGVSFEMIAVKGGSFTMGSQQGVDEKLSQPAHEVLLSDYYIGKFEITQELWLAVMGTTVSQQRDKENPKGEMHGKGNDYPMYYINWNDAQEFITKINQMTGQNFRLPTEAEWEYAARGGNKSKGYTYSGSNSINEVAWWHHTSGKKIHPIGRKMPNELGIYDMSGNVEEWCQDWFGDYNADSQTNPIGPNKPKIKNSRIVRGGCYYNIADICKVSYRGWHNVETRLSCMGFRIAIADFCE